MKAWWLAGLAAGLMQGSAQAEVRGVPVDQLRRVSDTPVVDTGEGDVLPAAVPYGSIAMPPLPQPVSRTIRTVREVPAPATASAATAVVVSQTIQVVTVSESAPLPRINAESCRTALKLTAEMAMIAYEQYPRQAYMKLVAAATLADDAARSGGIPNLKAFRAATDDLPWFGPYKGQLSQGTNAVQLTCTPMGGVAKR